MSVKSLCLKELLSVPYVPLMYIQIIARAGRFTWWKGSAREIQEIKLIDFLVFIFNFTDIQILFINIYFLKYFQW